MKSKPKSFSICSKEQITRQQRKNMTRFKKGRKRKRKEKRKQGRKRRRGNRKRRPSQRPSRTQQLQQTRQRRRRSLNQSQNQLQRRNRLLNKLKQTLKLILKCKNRNHQMLQNQQVKQQYSHCSKVFKFTRRKSQTNTKTTSSRLQHPS